MPSPPRRPAGRSRSAIRAPRSARAVSLKPVKPEISMNTIAASWRTGSARKPGFSASQAPRPGACTCCSNSLWLAKCRARRLSSHICTAPNSDGRGTGRGHRQRGAQPDSVGEGGDVEHRPGEHDADDGDKGAGAVPPRQQADQQHRQQRRHAGVGKPHGAVAQRAVAARQMRNCPSPSPRRPAAPDRMATGRRRPRRSPWRRAPRYGRACLHAPPCR